MSKTIMITGGAGFIGAKIAKELLYWGYKIIILDRLDKTVNLTRLNTIPNWYNHISEGRVKFIWWDLKSELSDSVIEELKEPDIVLHLAAGSHVDRSVKDPLLFTMDNIVGTVNLMNWIRELKNPPRFIFMSSDEIFGTPMNMYYGFREEDSPNPSNPYSSSKAGAEMMVRGFATTYKIPSNIIRMTNIIGTAQNREKWIPKCIRAISNNKELEIHSNNLGTIAGTRYYLDSRELCLVIRLLLNYLEDSKEQLIPGKRDIGVFHISGKEEISNLYIAESIAKIMGRELRYKLVPFTIDRPYHDLRYRLSMYKINNLLKWIPKIPIYDSLEHIVNWYKSHLEWL